MNDLDFIATGCDDNCTYFGLSLMGVVAFAGCILSVICH